MGQQSHKVHVIKRADVIPGTISQLRESGEEIYIWELPQNPSMCVCHPQNPVMQVGVVIVNTHSPIVPTHSQTWLA